MKMIHLDQKKYAQVTASIGLGLAKAMIGILIGSSLITICWAGNLEAAQKLPTDLTELSLEELMNIEITSVSKKAQKLSDAAAAVFVITQEDIRRSGVTSIPEALRMVPGLQVARIDANKWAITSRGFNGRLANKLLVLIDGRSVYSPLYSGVFWEAQHTLLEDVDRIEVIRGPGATLWGANAVNGVINIMTNRQRRLRVAWWPLERGPRNEVLAAFVTEQSWQTIPTTGPMQNISTGIMALTPQARRWLMIGKL